MRTIPNLDFWDSASGSLSRLSGSRTLWMLPIYGWPRQRKLKCSYRKICKYLFFFVSSRQSSFAISQGMGQVPRTLEEQAPQKTAEPPVISSSLFISWESKDAFLQISKFSAAFQSTYHSSNVGQETCCDVLAILHLLWT